MSRITMCWKDFKRKAVTLSYDDGVVFDRRLIEIMDKYGLKGTFNLNSGYFATEKNERKLTQDEAVELYKNSPHEIAVHGVKHLALTAVDEGVATYDIIVDRKNLESLFGRVVKGMAYAYGAFDDKTVEVLKRCGISYARTTVSTESFDVPTDWLRMPATCHHGNPRLMELAKKFVEEPEHSYILLKRPRLFYLWGHSYEFNDNDNWEVIEEFAKYIGNREDIWYATNGEIYDYVKAYDNLEYSADGKIVRNPSALGVYIKDLQTWKEYYIPSGETVVLE